MALARPQVQIDLAEQLLAAVSRLIDRRRGWFQALGDAGAWTIGLLVAMWGSHGDATVGSMLSCAAVVAVLLIGTALASGLYRSRWQYGSLEEIAVVLGPMFVAIVGVALVNALLVSPRLPLSDLGSAIAFAAVLMGGLRYSWRLLIDHGRRPSPADRQRLVVFGAGRAGQKIITWLLSDPESAYVPVALLDDDLSRRHKRIKGLEVVGGRSEIARVAAETGAHALLVAIPSADASVVRDVLRVGEEAGLAVRVLPTVAELVAGTASVADIREVTEEDLLGRHRIETDIDQISGYIRDRRVLVTGAGGSIGSELCRQLARLRPAELIMLDRDESALHAVQMSIEGRALLDSEDLVVADIRDAQRLRDLFVDRSPEVVFHAAALKHLPLLEMHAAEALKTNVWGTWNVLQAARAAGTRVFVNISTDKAANPTSVLGYSKRIAERLTAGAAAAEPADHRYLSVRFGNVIGSRGSVIPAFRAQIAAGGPVTVTDPHVTRYFMMIKEAVELVLQAGAIGRPGEALVLDMGEPVRIEDVARRLIAASGRDVDVVYTGMREGEKLHEELLGDGESDQRPFHPLITHTAVPALAPEPVLTVDPRMTGVVTALATLCRLPAGPPAARAAFEDAAEPGDRLIRLTAGPAFLRLPDALNSAVLTAGTERSSW